jgi:hypothetical protein
MHLGMQIAVNLFRPIFFHILTAMGFNLDSEHVREMKPRIFADTADQRGLSVENP